MPVNPRSILLCATSWEAAFARSDLDDFLEAENYLYATRLPANGVLQREIGPF